MDPVVTSRPTASDMTKHFVDGDVEVDVFLPDSRESGEGATPPCLVLVAGTGWLGGLTTPGFYPLNRMIARRATRTGYACALVFARHRCLTQTCGVEVLATIAAAAAAATRWPAAAALVILARRGLVDAARLEILARVLLPAWTCAAVALAAVAVCGALASRRRRAEDNERRRALVDDAVEDVRRAWRFVAARAEALGVDGARVVLGGYSSGAHLALLLALRLEAPPKAVVLVSGALLDVHEAFDAAWDEPVALDTVFRVGPFAAAVRGIINAFIDDILGTRSPGDRSRASLPADLAEDGATQARLRASKWQVSLCANELGGFQPFQRAFFDNGYAKLKGVLEAAGAPLVYREIRGNHWTLPLNIDEAFAALLPLALLDDE